MIRIERAANLACDDLFERERIHGYDRKNVFQLSHASNLRDLEVRPVREFTIARIRFDAHIEIACDRFAVRRFTSQQRQEIALIESQVPEKRESAIDSDRENTDGWITQLASAELEIIRR
jgi:hypothetical protein